MFTSGVPSARGALLSVGVIVVACAALLAGIALMAPRAEGFVAAQKQGQGRRISLDTAGDGDCRRVTVSPSAFDSARDHARACAIACAQQPDYRRLAMGAVTVGNDIQCQCCDPSSRVTLESEVRGSAPCVAGSTFGTVRDERAMFVRDGCKGIFAWDDGTLVTCQSEVGQPAQCAYQLDMLKVTNLRAAQDEERARLQAELERREAAQRERQAKEVRGLQADLAASWAKLSPGA